MISVKGLGFIPMQNFFNDRGAKTYKEIDDKQIDKNIVHGWIYL